jgi:hypothetical protein
MDFTVDALFPHPAGNELGHLGAEIEDQDLFTMDICSHLIIPNPAEPEAEKLCHRGHRGHRENHKP